MASLDQVVKFEANRAYPSLPDPGADIAAHSALLQALKHNIEIHERRTRDVLNSFVRVQELVDLGLIDLNGNQLSTEASAVGGGGGASVHNDLTGRSDADCHPISAITALSSSLSSLSGGISTNAANLLAHTSDATIHFTEASIDHGSIAGLGDDDHLQYALLLGRAGGQTLIGGTGAGDDLTLVGTSGALAGARVNMNSPVEFAAYGPTGAAYGFNYSATENFTGAFVGGGLNFSGDITFAGGTFIYESFRGAPTINTNGNPGFAAYTVLQALPVLNSGPGAGHNPLAPLILNAGVQVRHAFTGTRTVSSVAAVNFASTMVGAVSGAVLNCTNWTGLTVAPKWNTVAGSTISFGNITGVDVQAPAQGLFSSSAGIERMSSFYGMKVANPGINNGFGTAPVAAIRSEISLGTNRYFLLNAGTAPSDMGAAHMYFDDNFGVAYGGAGVGSFDYWESWNAAGYQRHYFLANADEIRISNAVNNQILHDYRTSEFTFNTTRGFSLGAQTGTNGNQFGNFVFGASSTLIGGEYSQFLLTQAGNLTVDHAMGGVFGWTINAPSITLGTGTVTTAGALNVGGNVSQGSVNRFGIRILSNPAGGSGVNAALWVTAGLTRLDGRLDINQPIALGGGAAPTLGTIGGTGPTAAAQAQWVEIDINGVAHWLPAWT